MAMSIHIWAVRVVMAVDRLLMQFCRPKQALCLAIWLTFLSSICRLHFRVFGITEYFSELLRLCRRIGRRKRIVQIAISRL
jgi:hypothetical protein